MKFKHYWGCYKCFTEMGGKPSEGVATAVLKTCEYCDGKNQQEDEALFPWVDYNWPNRETDKIARLNRD